MSCCVLGCDSDFECIWSSALQSSWTSVQEGYLFTGLLHIRVLLWRYLAVAAGCLVCIGRYTSSRLFVLLRLPKPEKTITMGLWCIFIFSSLCVGVWQFDVHSWLNERRPMMSDRSRFITSIGIALQACGLEPTDEATVLSDVRICNTHMSSIFFDFICFSIESLSLKFIGARQSILVAKTPNFHFRVATEITCTFWPSWWARV